jgi:hypothetical protein
MNLPYGEYVAIARTGGLNILGILTIFYKEGIP